jgi:hypothetical protein
MPPQAIAIRGAADLDAAHIVLETPGHGPRSIRRPENVAAEFDLDSVVRATRTRLTLYKEGLLRVRTEYYGGRRKERLLDLRYLDPRPRVSRVASFRMLYPAVGATTLATILILLGSIGVFSPAACLLAAFVFGLAAGVFSWVFLYRSGEQAVFRTARGQADVLVLFGTLGTIRALRRIVPALVAAIREAAEPESDKKASLREELREHYRLAETGVITEDECSTCTQRILHQFV